MVNHASFVHTKKGLLYFPYYYRLKSLWPRNECSLHFFWQQRSHVSPTIDLNLCKRIIIIGETNKK